MGTATGRLLEIAKLFSRLGCLAFGGPAAHIAMLEDEVVERRGWIDRQHFLDLIGATQLIPGPNSTEMVLHVGYERAGARGLLVAGFCFIGPAAVLTGVLAWAYTRWGLLPNVDPLLAGLRPAVMAIILAALLKLGKKALGSAPGTAAPVALAIAVAAAVLVGVPELTALAVGGAVGTAVFYALRRPQPPSAVGPSDGPSDGPTEAPPGGTRSRSGVAAALPLAAASAGVSTAGAGAVSLWQLGLVFLKVGAVLYGSGYVLIAFLEGDLVDRLGWLSQAQLLDAIAIGQLTPGPVLTTATFVGYVLAGVPGAIVATAAIFLPSFFFVSLLNPVVPRLRRRPATAAFLDAVNVAALALMAAVTLRLASTTLVDAPAWLIAVGSAVALVRFKLSPLWLVPAAAVAGWASYGLLG